MALHQERYHPLREESPKNTTGPCNRGGRDRPASRTHAASSGLAQSILQNEAEQDGTVRGEDYVCRFSSSFPCPSWSCGGGCFSKVDFRSRYSRRVLPNGCSYPTITPHDCGLSCNRVESNRSQRSRLPRRAKHMSYKLQQSVVKLVRLLIKHPVPRF